MIPLKQDTTVKLYPTQLCLCNVNSRSVRNKVAAITDHVIQNHVELCIITETCIWLGEDCSVTCDALSLDGYSFELDHIPRSTERSIGGVGIMHLDYLKM